MIRKSLNQANGQNFSDQRNDKTIATQKFKILEKLGAISRNKIKRILALFHDQWALLTEFSADDYLQARQNHSLDEDDDNL